MNKSKQIIMKVAAYSSFSVAITTALFVLALVTTFNMDPWCGIKIYADNFKPVSLMTVIPSLLLAVSYLIFCVSVHYLTQEEQKIWSHLAMNFGLVYIIISVANYMIQLLTVIPSIQSQTLDGLSILVSGNPYSIFFALMGSYFFMCISLFFVGLLYPLKVKVFLYSASILCILCFAIGALSGISMIMIIGACCWIFGTVTGMTIICVNYVKCLKNKSN